MLIEECDGYNCYSCDECETFIGQYDHHGIVLSDRNSEQFQYCVDCRDEFMDWIDVVEDINGDIQLLHTPKKWWHD